MCGTKNNLKHKCSKRTHKYSFTFANKNKRPKPYNKQDTKLNNHSKETPEQNTGSLQPKASFAMR